MKATTDINPQLVKQLREKTNAGMMDCKRALTEAEGDLAKAETILRTKGIASAGKKASRATKEGIVASYIHLQGKVGVLVEVNCETDFVAKNENFRGFVKDITLHIAAAHPLYVSREDVPGKLIEAEREIYKAQVKGKPANVTEKIVDGKLDKFYSTVCLLEQGFIKNPDVAIKDLLNGKIAELGENIVIRRFTRYLVGEPVPAEA
jgi:elongation factor Ts